MRPNYMAKETYLYGKTYLSQEKRTVPLRNLYGKRDLLLWQKRPNYMAKETYRH